MSNSQKITQMTPANVPLSGSELVPIVQNGENKKVAVSGFITNNLAYQGVWNAATNSPALASGVGTTGYYYIVNVPGNTTLDGNTGWQVGDWVIFSDTGVWQKIGGGTLSSIQIANDTSTNDKFNIPFTTASSGLINTQYVDDNQVWYNPSAKLFAAPNMQVNVPTGGESYLYFRNVDTGVEKANINVYDNIYGNGYGYFEIYVTDGVVAQAANLNFNGYGAFGFDDNFGSAGQVLVSATSTGHTYWGNVGDLPSLKAAKANVAPITDVSWLDKLNTVTYNKRKQDKDGYTKEIESETDFGLIAEEVEAINPEMCFYKDGKLAGVRYMQLIAPLLKKVQDLEARLAQLEGK